MPGRLDCYIARAITEAIAFRRPAGRVSTYRFHFEIRLVASTLVSLTMTAQCRATPATKI